MIRPGNNREMLELASASSAEVSSDDRAPQLEEPKVQGKVDAVIHEWFTDLWLLITGEEMRDDVPFRIKKDGRAFAMLCGGQLRLLESKPSALNALHSVGVVLY